MSEQQAEITDLGEPASSPIADARLGRADNLAIPGLAGLLRKPPQERAVLDRRTLNRTLLARQLLLGRGRGTPLQLLDHLAGVDLEPLLAAGAASLTARPQQLAELRNELGERWPAHDSDALAQVVRYLVPLVQVTPRGVWGQTLQTTFTTLERWLGPQTSEESADDSELMRSYLGAFGPASPADLRQEAERMLTFLTPNAPRRKLTIS